MQILQRGSGQVQRSDESQRALLKFNSELIERTTDSRNSSSVPVTATIAPIRWQPSTMMSFCCGEVRANTISVWYLRISSSWSEFSSLSSVPWMTAAFASRGLTSDTGIFNRWAMSSTVSLPDQRISLSQPTKLKTITRRSFRSNKMMIFLNNLKELIYSRANVQSLWQKVYISFDINLGELTYSRI